MDAGAHRTVILSLLAVIAVHQFGTGIVFALVPLRLALDGVAATIIGGLSTLWSIAFLVGCLTAPAIIGRFGPRAAIYCGSGANVVAALILFATDHVGAWAVSRLVSGFATATAFTTIEAWLAAQSTPQTRGLVFGSYMIVNRTVFGLGQLLLSWIDPRISALFLVAASAYLATPLLSALVRAEPPRVARRSLSGFFDLPRLAPAAAAAALIHGLVTMAAPALYPVYGVKSGLSSERIAIVLALFQLGGLLAQFPVTALSDRVGRRVMMAWVGAICATVSLVLLSYGASPSLWALVALAIWGGAPSALYALAAAHANDLAPEAERTTWTATLMLIWGIGSMLGPIVASMLMDRFGISMLFVYATALCVGFTLFILWRRSVRPPTGQRRPVDDVPQRMPGPAAAQLEDKRTA
jgi:MFS family permease